MRENVNGAAAENRERVAGALVAIGGAATQAQIADASGLSRSVVQSAVADLTTRRAVGRMEQRSGGAGRPAQAVALDPSVGYVVGVAFGQRSFRVGTADLLGRMGGEPPSHPFLPPEGDDRPSAVESGPFALERLDLAVGEVRREIEGRPRDELVAIGLAVPGPVNSSTGKVEPLPGIRSIWDGVPVAEELRKRLGPEWRDVPIEVGNDATLAALAERRFGRLRPRGGIAPETVPDSLNAIYLKWSHGIGCGVIIRGELYEGTHGVAGEFGHTVVPDADDADLEHVERCRLCGHEGCLESLAAADAIVAYALRDAPETTSGKPWAQTLNDVLERGKRDAVTALISGREQAADPVQGGAPPSWRRQLDELLADTEAQESARKVCSDAVRHAAEYIGRALGGPVNVLAPELVVIGGEIGNVGFRIWGTPLQKELSAHTMPAVSRGVSVDAGQLSRRSVVQGAAARAIDANVARYLAGRQAAGATPGPRRAKRHYRRNKGRDRGE